MTYQSLQIKIDATTSVIQQAFILDLGAAMAREHYETRRYRQKQGIEKAKANGAYKGQKVDTVLYENIKTMLTGGMNYTAIQNALGCSRNTIARVKIINNKQANND